MVDDVVVGGEEVAEDGGDAGFGLAEVRNQRLFRLAENLAQLAPGTIWATRGGWGMKLVLPALVLLLALPPASAATESGATTETCYGYDATYVGTPGDDEVMVDEKNNVVATLGGNDFVRVAPVARKNTGVFICLGDGNDDMTGGPFDKLDGGSGNDRVNFYVCGTDLVYNVESVIANGYADECK